MDSLDHLQLAILDPVLACLTARGREAKGVLESRNRYHILTIVDPYEINDKHRILRVMLPQNAPS